MKRRIFNLLAALSLVMCVATVVMWVRSYATADDFSYSRPAWAILMESGGGQFRFECVVADYVGDSGFSHSTYRADGPLGVGMMMPGSRAFGDRESFWIVTGERWGAYHYAVFLPPWFVFALALVLPTAWTVLRVRERAAGRREGLCRSCGYDLRATPDRCPECGTAVANEPVEAK